MNSIGIPIYQYQYKILGQYQYDLKKDYYYQSHTGKRFYIYRIKLGLGKGGWWVGKNPGTAIGLLKNKQETETIPTTEWCVDPGFLYSWKADPAMTITYGPLKNICTIVTISDTGPAAAELSTYLGMFNKTEQWNYGRPVYINSHGKYLHVFNLNDEGNWAVSSEFGKYNMWSTGAQLSPVDSKDWIYWNGSEKKPVNISIECKN